MNLGLVIYGNLDTLTGGFIYDRRLVDHLRCQGDHVRVFSLPWRNYPSHLWDNFSRTFFQSLVRADLDILIQDELNHPSLFLFNWALKKRIGCPVVSIVHHLRSSELRPEWQNRFYGLVEKHYLMHIDGFIFNSLTTRASVCELMGEVGPSVVVYPGRDGVNPDVTKEDVKDRAQGSGPLRILFVGSLIPRKELHSLIAALGLLPLAHWRLDVVGSTESDRRYSAYVKQQISEMGLESNIRLLGTLTGESLADRYRNCHVLAVPSSYEGFGIVYLEAMGYGLPAIASTSGAAREIVTHGRDGFLVKPGDIQTISLLIDQLSRDRSKLNRMSLAALNRYWEHPSWAEEAEMTRNFLLKTVAQYQSKGGS